MAGGITPSTPSRILLSNADGAGINDGATHAGPARRPGDRAGAVGPVHAHASPTSASPASSSCRRPARSPGLAKRELKGTEIVTVNTPDDLKAAKDLIARHGVAPSHEPTMAFVLAVATVAGTFEPLPDVDEGAQIKAGQVLGHIVTRQGNAEVTAHDSGSSSSGSPTTTTRSARANPSPASEATCEREDRSVASSPTKGRP